MRNSYFLQLHSIKISITKTGNDKGPAIIFFHSASFSKDCWQNQLSDKLLADNFKLYAIDLPGHCQSGWSTNPAKDYSLKGMGNIVAEIIDALNIEQYMVVTLSFSGNLLAECVNKLKGCMGILMAGPSIIGENLGLSSFILEHPFLHLLSSKKASKEEIDGYANFLMHNPTGDSIGMVVKNYQETDSAFRETLGEVLAVSDYSDEIYHLKKSGLPLAIVYGKEEAIVNHMYLIDAGLTLWNNKIHLVDNAGHFVNMDEPEKFNLILKAFADDIFGE